MNDVTQKGKICDLLTLQHLPMPLCRTTLSGDLSSSGVVGRLLEASNLDTFQTDLGESGKGI